MTETISPENKTLLERFNAAIPAFRAGLVARRPTGYADLVERVVSILSCEADYRSMDPERITVINHGDYQGTLLFVIGATGYQPSDYWTVFVGYGSCSGCDWFQRVADMDERDYSSDEIPMMSEATQNVCVVFCQDLISRIHRIPSW